MPETAYGIMSLAVATFMREKFTHQCVVQRFFPFPIHHHSHEMDSKNWSEMKVKLSAKFESAYGHIDWKPVTIGQSGAEVYRSDQFVLKIQKFMDRSFLWNEKAKMEWLKGKLPVPDMIEYDMDDRCEYLIMTRLPGTDAAQTKWKNEDPLLLVYQLGRALRQWHDQIKITDCPFDVRLKYKLEALDPSADREGFEREAPDDEDLVVTHGDYCLPNIMIDEEQCVVIGFVDIGRAGIADRYYDIALGLRSIQYNLEQDYRQPFLDGYGGLSSWNVKKIDYYQQLDEYL